ncbi:bile acid:sodium symporter family protein [Wenyingzhuangia sp. 2_MG-2023]|uniref:bile acid:sodium symporter family protein n=1 Tax=Wenyingzhuangia sp. 2_MG-2023 TaxID=3062639 RepID=UPI0026E23DBC|nr:bile acid:sodium symporter family protein [Wenyingzhuangia sp. 2_MG-2023]MDO6736374.1 bile acid:sodium symporter family protein [Wenyingzhuangia sp. 2_MG-2023]
MSDLLIKAFLPLSLAMIMFGMGMTLTPNDFKSVFQHPKAVIIGLINQIVLLPLLAFLLALIFQLDAVMAVGIVILAACPGGPTSNMITQICNGNIALSVTLTAIASFTSIVTINIIASYALDYFGTTTAIIKLPIVDTTLQIMTITLIPISLGMLVRKFKTGFAIRMEKPMKIASTSIFVLIFIGIIATNFSLLGDALKRIGVVTLLLNIGTIGLGYMVAKIFKLNYKDAIAIGVEGGIQNGTLAFVITTTILNNMEMAIPTAAYSVWMYASASILMWQFGKKKSNIALSV